MSVILHIKAQLEERYGFEFIVYPTLDSFCLSVETDSTEHARNVKSFVEGYISGMKQLSLYFEKAISDVQVW